MHLNRVLCFRVVGYVTTLSDVRNDNDLSKFIRQNMKAGKPKGRTLTKGIDKYCSKVYEIISNIESEKGIRGVKSLEAGLEVCARMGTTRWSNMLFQKFTEWDIPPSRAAYLNAILPHAVIGDVESVSRLIKEYLLANGKETLMDPEFYNLLLRSLSTSATPIHHSLEILNRMSTLGISSVNCYCVVLDQVQTKQQLTTVVGMMGKFRKINSDSTVLTRSFIKAYSNIGLSHRIMKVITVLIGNTQPVPLTYWHRLMESYVNCEKLNPSDVEEKIIDAWKRMTVSTYPVPATYTILLRFLRSRVSSRDDKFIITAENTFNHGCSLNLHLKDTALWEGLLLCYLAVSDVQKIAALLSLCSRELRWSMKSTTVIAVRVKYPELSLFFKQPRKPKTPKTTQIDYVYSCMLSGLVCVVCGRDDRIGELRRSGFKCTPCIGTSHKKGKRSKGDTIKKINTDIPLVVGRDKLLSPSRRKNGGGSELCSPSPRRKNGGGSELCSPSPRRKNGGGSELCSPSPSAVTDGSSPQNIVLQMGLDEVRSKRKELEIRGETLKETTARLYNPKSLPEEPEITKKPVDNIEWNMKYSLHSRSQVRTTSRRTSLSAPPCTRSSESERVPIVKCRRREYVSPIPVKPTRQKPLLLIISFDSLAEYFSEIVSPFRDPEREIPVVDTPPLKGPHSSFAPVPFPVGPDVNNFRSFSPNQRVQSEEMSFSPERERMKLFKSVSTDQEVSLLKGKHRRRSLSRQRPHSSSRTKSNDSDKLETLSRSRQGGSSFKISTSESLSPLANHHSPIRTTTDNQLTQQQRHLDTLDSKLQSMKLLKPIRDLLISISDQYDVQIILLSGTTKSKDIPLLFSTTEIVGRELGGGAKGVSIARLINRNSSLKRKKHRKDTNVVFVGRKEELGSGYDFIEKLVSPGCWHVISDDNILNLVLKIRNKITSISGNHLTQNQFANMSLRQLAGSEPMWPGVVYSSGYRTVDAPAALLPPSLELSTCRSPVVRSVPLPVFGLPVRSECRSQFLSHNPLNPFDNLSRDDDSDSDVSSVSSAASKTCPLASRHRRAHSATGPNLTRGWYITIPYQRVVSKTSATVDKSPMGFNYVSEGAIPGQIVSRN